MAEYKKMKKIKEIGMKSAGLDTSGSGERIG